MLKNYFITAFRYLIKNKAFSFINIAGMATGLACVLVITNYVIDLSHSDVLINKHTYYSDYLPVRFTNRNLEQNVEVLADKRKDFNPEKPFEYYFVEEELYKLYKNEVRKSKIFAAFAFISYLGLLGILAYSLQLRTKEVGIRKVLGVGMVSLLNLFSKKYVAMVLIANIIAIPMVWYFARSWLNSFEYRTDLSPGLFMTALIIACVLAITTVRFKVLKTALMNPVKTLKDE